ncbi:MAG: cell division protein ZapA [Pseudomonadota bacterium]
MTEKKDGVKVSIMHREFTVACKEEESESLVDAAAYLDRQMKQIAKGSQVLGLDRCAIMAALNITHELLELKKELGQGQTVAGRLEQLNERIDKVVADIQQVAI